MIIIVITMINAAVMAPIIGELCSPDADLNNKNTPTDPSKFHIVHFLWLNSVLFIITKNPPNDFCKFHVGNFLSYNLGMVTFTLGN